jgi:hypothetical protein
MPTFSEYPKFVRGPRGEPRVVASAAEEAVVCGPPPASESPSASEASRRTPGRPKKGSASKDAKE